MPTTRTKYAKAGNEYTPGFLKQVRNFMNNWEVSGGSFSFDGYRAKLRVNQPTSIEPFTVRRNGGLKVIFQTGKVITDAPPFLIDVKTDTVPQTNEITVTDDNDTEIWCEIYVSTLADPNKNTRRWIVVNSDGGAPSDYYAVMKSGASVPTQTFDPGDFTDAPLYESGYDTIYFPIATVTAASGEVTGIVQHFTGLLPMLFDASLPYAMYAPTQGALLFGNINGTVSAAPWEQLIPGAEGAILYIEGETDSESPAWLAPGSDGDILTMASGKPAWASKASVFDEITVITDVRDNSGTLQKKTRTVRVLDPGEESAWTNA